MPRRNEQQVAPDEPNAGSLTKAASDTAKSASHDEALWELFFLVGELAVQGLSPEYPTLADAVHARYANAPDRYSHNLAKELGDDWAKSPGRVASCLSRLQRWYNREHTGGEVVRLFEGGPSNPTGLTPEGKEFFVQISTENNLEAFIRVDVEERARELAIEALARLPWTPSHFLLARAARFRQTPKVKDGEVAERSEVSKERQEGKRPTGFRERVKPEAPKKPHELADEYERVYQEMLAERKAFLDKLATQFSPRFNAKVRQKLETEKPESREEREAFAEWIMTQLDNLGLTLFDPIKRRPAYFQITASNEYRLIPRGATTGKKSVQFSEFLPLQIAISGPFKGSQVVILKQINSQGEGTGRMG